MMLASVVVLGLLGETAAVKTELAIVTAPSRSWAERERAFGVLQTLDYREVIPRILPLLPPFGRPPKFFARSAGPTPITETTPFDEQVEHGAHELVSSLLNRPLPSEERGRFLVTVLGGPDAEENFGKLQTAMFRHWVPELEKPVLRILRDGKRVDLRASAADLLVSTASAPRYLADALQLIRSQPTPEEQSRVFLLVFCRNLAALTPAAWTEILRTGLEILTKVSLPRAGALSVQLGDWLHLSLPRYTIHPERGATPEEIARERDEGVAIVRAWYVKHRADLPAQAARVLP